MGREYFVPAISAFGLASIFSVVSYHFIEMPGAKLGRKIS